MDNEETMKNVQDFVEESLERYGVYVDCHVLMPDHAHLIITIAADSETPIGKWVKAFKAMVARHRFKWRDREAK